MDQFWILAVVPVTIRSISGKRDTSAADGAKELCQLASEYTGISVRHEYFEQLDEEEVYDGIRTCSSILHVKKNALPDILRRMTRGITEMLFCVTKITESGQDFDEPPTVPPFSSNKGDRKSL